MRVDCGHGGRAASPSGGIVYSSTNAGVAACQRRMRITLRSSIGNGERGSRDAERIHGKSKGRTCRRALGRNRDANMGREKNTSDFLAANSGRTTILKSRDGGRTALPSGRIVKANAGEVAERKRTPSERIRLYSSRVNADQSQILNF